MCVVFTPVRLTLTIKKLLVVANSLQIFILYLLILLHTGEPVDNDLHI